MIRDDTDNRGLSTLPTKKPWDLALVYRLICSMNIKILKIKIKIDPGLKDVKGKLSKPIFCTPYRSRMGVYSTFIAIGLLTCAINPFFESFEIQDIAHLKLRSTTVLW
jgi:hypothetical protein